MADDLERVIAQALADPSAPAGPSVVSTPWPKLTRHLSGGLLPGLYAICGPVSSGRTQLLFQWGLAAADAGQFVTLVVPHGRARPVVARLTGLARRTDWSTLGYPEQLPALRTGAEALLRRRQLGVDLTAEAPLDAARHAARRRRATVAHGPILIAVDDVYESPRAFAVAAQSIVAETHATIIVVLNDPPEGPFDGIFQLTPHAEATSGVRALPYELDVTALRYGRRGAVSLRFNGTWFEEEPDEIDLELTEVTS